MEMDRKRRTIGEALASVPTDATVSEYGTDLGRAAKRARLDDDLDVLRARLNAAAHSVQPSSVSSVPTLVMTDAFGIREGESVVRIPSIINNNERRGPLRADGYEWPRDAVSNLAETRAQPMQRAWMEHQAQNLNAVSQNPTMRFVGVLATVMNRKPLSFLSSEGARALQEAAQAAQVYAQRRDIDRKVVDVGAKNAQLTMLATQLDRIEAERAGLALPQFVSGVPLPPYSDGTDVTRTLLDPDIEDAGDAGFSAILHAWPREPREGAPEAIEQTFGARYGENQLRSLFALARRVRLLTLAVRLGEPGNPYVLHAGKAHTPMSSEDRADAIEYISTQWQRYDARELGQKGDDAIRELFFATWAYDALRNQFGGVPLDLSLATWHGASAITLFANYLVREDTVALPADNESRRLAEALRYASRAAIVDPDGSAPAYINRDAWGLLSYLFATLRDVADGKLTAEQQDIVRAAQQTLEGLARDAAYLQSDMALATLTVDDSVSPPYEQRAALRVALLEKLRLAPVPASAAHVLDLDALAVMHAITVAADIRPPTSDHAELRWTSPAPRRATYARAEQYADGLTRTKGEITADAGLVAQFAVLGRNVLLVQTRSDVPALRDVGRALGWVDIATMQTTLRLLDTAVHVLARDHLLYLTRRGALPSREHWKTLAPLINTRLSDREASRDMLYYALSVLPDDLVALRTDMTARVQAAAEDGVLNQRLWQLVSAAAIDRPVALVYALAIAQNERDRRRRVQLDDTRAALVRDMDAARRILASVAAETPSIPGAGATAAAAYSQRAEWVQQPHVGGLAILSLETLGSIEQAKAAVRRWVPALRSASLETLTEHFDSGLAVAFGEFVGTMSAKSELLHERDYLRAEHYTEVPKRFHECIRSLARFDVRGPPNGMQTVTDVAANLVYRSHAPGATNSTDAYTVF